MKTKATLFSFGRLRWLVLGAGLFVATLSSMAQDARFFRITGPVPTTITAITSAGSIIWTNNTPTNTTFTVQTATSLSGVSNWVDYVQIPTTKGIKTNQIIDFNPPANMALIPAGSFTMGDNLDGDSSALPLHTVYVSAFYMDKYDVTEALWSQVFNWATNHGYSFDYPGSVPGSAYSSYSKGPNYPVVIVDWYDCVKWCNARSEKEGKVPAYYTTSTQTVVYRTGQVNVDNNSVKWSSGYRLATEAEWEKAARGGLSGQRFPWGNTINESQANYYAYPSGYNYDLNPYTGDNTNFNTGNYPYTSPVGSFAPNGYGLYDMAGNVWQWCWDWYGSYGSASQTDPRGASSGSSRVFRGGGYGSIAVYCRLAFRGGIDPSYDGRDYGYIFYMGFRSVLAPGQ
jgi:sulfatase modifying factor 1